MKVIKRGLSILAILVGLGLLTGSQAAWAKPKHGSQVDPTTVTPCTTATVTLSTNNIVYIIPGFTTSFTGTCIKVTANNSLILVANGEGAGVQNIVGPGGIAASPPGPPPGTPAGIAIDIEGSNNVINGKLSNISGFAIGVLDNGTDTLGDNLDFSGNGTGLKMTGHTVKWSDFNSSFNTGSGVWINGCADTCVLDEFFVSDNTGDGMLIDGAAQGTVATVFISQFNGGNGVHVGHPTGPNGGNVFINDAAVSDQFAVNNNGQDGVFLDVSENGAIDVVTGVDSKMNGTSGPGFFDMHDATSNCGSTGKFNLWSSNAFDMGSSKAGATTPAGCIPLLPNL